MLISTTQCQFSKLNKFNEIISYYSTRLAEQITSTTSQPESTGSASCNLVGYRSRVLWLGCTGL